MNTCEDCKYLGNEFEYLRGYDGVKEWRHCKYSLPFYVTPKAVPMTGKTCKVWKRRKGDVRTT